MDDKFWTVIIFSIVPLLIGATAMGVMTMTLYTKDYINQWRKEIWYPSPGDQIEVRLNFHIKKYTPFGMNDDCVLSYDNYYYNKGQRFLVVGLLTTKSEGLPFLIKRLEGKMTLLPLGNCSSTNIKTISWMSKDQLTLMGFKPLFFKVNEK